MRKLKAKFWEGEKRLSVLRESVWNWNTDWNDTHCKQMCFCSFNRREGKHRVKAEEMLLTGYVKHAETRVSCYWKWGSGPMLECCSCSPTPISLPLSLSSNRSLHHLLGLCLTPSVMVHFTQLINNASSSLHTFIFLPEYELQPLSPYLPPSHVRPF